MFSLVKTFWIFSNPSSWIIANSMDSTTYLHQEQERQFGQQKMDEVYNSRGLGKNKLSENVEQELSKAQKFARLKGWNIKGCQICGAEVIAKDVRARVFLCDKHRGFYTAVERILSQRKQQNLKQVDIAKLVQTRTVRTGPFWNPKDPDGSIAKRKAEEAQK